MLDDEEQQDEQPDWRVPCPECEGHGVIWIEGAGLTPFPRRCSFCRGKGVVDVD